MSDLKVVQAQVNWFLKGCKSFSFSKSCFCLIYSHEWLCKQRIYYKQWICKHFLFIFEPTKEIL